jgi:hypothetical protein
LLAPAEDAAEAFRTQKLLAEALNAKPAAAVKVHGVASRLQSAAIDSNIEVEREVFRHRTHNSA